MLCLPSLQIACAFLRCMPLRLLPGRRLRAVPCAHRYAMEAQSHLELSGIVYPPCPKYKQAAALAEQGMQGPGGAMAPGQQMPPGGEPSAGLRPLLNTSSVYGCLRCNPLCQCRDMLLIMPSWRRGRLPVLEACIERLAEMRI